MTGKKAVVYLLLGKPRLFFMSFYAHLLHSAQMFKFRQLLAFGLIATTLSSCATVFGGRITDYQRTKPLPGQPQREVRVAALILDIFLVGALGVVVDFATGAIYKPHPRVPLTPVALPAAPTPEPTVK